MRTLNRPMFNMGGPIKEGVMHGIREPYAGGQLVRPGPGRPGYAGEETFWTRFLANYTPKAFSSPKKIISRLNPFKRAQAVKYIKPAAQNLQGIFVRKPTSPGITSSGAGQQFIKNLKSFSFPGSAKALDWAKRGITYPFRKPKRTAVGALALSSDPGREAISYVGENIPNIIKSVTPNWIERMLSGEGKEPDKITTAQLPPGGGETALGSGEATYKKPSPVELLLAGKDNEKFALAERNKRVQKYLDLMGYKSAKKTAIADALIDASKIVSDRGTLDLKNITKELINPVIQATSRRLDKPQQIREAVGLMMTKAGLEKEMYDAKPGTILKNVQDMIKSGIPKDEAWAIATKGSKGVLSDLQAALATGKMSATDWPAFVRATGAEHGEEVTVITAEQIKEDPERYAKFKDKDIMEILEGADDGIYIIAGETVRIKGGKATQIK